MDPAGGGGERQEPSWYEQHGITYLTGTEVTQADLAAKSLVTSDQKRIGYEKLIIATGCRPVYLSDFKTPGADLQVGPACLTVKPQLIMSSSIIFRVRLFG